MRRRLRLVALLLLGATLVSCGQAAGETGQPGAPISEATPSPPTPRPTAANNVIAPARQ